MGSPAVSDDFAVLRQLIQPVFQFVQGDRDGARQMPGFLLLVWPHVDHHGPPIPHPAQQRFPVNRIEAYACFDEVFPHLLDFQNMPFGKRAKRFPRESFSEVVRRLEIPSVGARGGDLLAREVDPSG